MKLISPKLAASACLLAVLTAPVAVFAHPGDFGDRDKNKNKPHYAVAEPGTLAMMVAGLGLGMGLVFVGLRRTRKNSTA